MKKRLSCFTAFALVALFFTNAFAKTLKTPEIALYQTPSLKAKVLAHTPITTSFAPIYREKGWVKVAERSAKGQVGWVNEAQYHEALSAYYEPEVRTFYLSTRETTKDGKPVVNVVAYKNGKKINEKEAMALYQHVKLQQDQQWQHMAHLDREMTALAREDVDPFFNRLWVPLPMLEPGVVIIHEDSSKKAANPPKKS